MKQDYLEIKIDGSKYERVTNFGGVKTTICKNRFEILCLGLAEVNEQHAINELKAWIAKRREAEMREFGDMSKQVP